MYFIDYALTHCINDAVFIISKALSCSGLLMVSKFRGTVYFYPQTPISLFADIYLIDFIINRSYSRQR